MDIKDYELQMKEILGNDNTLNLKLKDVKRVKEKIVLIREDDTIYNCNLDKLNYIIDQLDPIIQNIKNSNDSIRKQLEALFTDHEEEYFKEIPSLIYDVYENGEEVPKYTMHYDNEGNFVKQLDNEGNAIIEANNNMLSVNGHRYTKEGIHVYEDDFLFKNKEFTVSKFDDIITNGYKVIDKNGNEFYFHEYGNEYALCKAVYKLTKDNLEITFVINNSSRDKIKIEENIEFEDRIDKVKYKYMDYPMLGELQFEEKYLIVSGIGMFIYDRYSNLICKYLPRKELKIIK